MDLPIKIDDVRFSIPDVLEQVSNEKFHDEKVKILQLNENLGLKIYLKALLHPNITFKLPRGKVPVINQIQKVEGTPSTGLYQLNDLHKFISGTTTCKALNDIQRERAFFELAETLDPEELECLVNLKDKKRDKWPGLYDQCVVDAFKDMFTAEELKLLDPEVPKPKPGPKTSAKTTK